MDFKALMTKLETINNKQVLTESEDRPDAKKKETTWTDKSGKKHPATTVQGHQSVKADKESDKEKKKHDRADEAVFKGSIAKALAEEFGYELEEQSIEEAEATNPWANDPAKSAAWAALTPEDQKWLGGADPTDPYILARAPNKGKPAAKPAADTNDPTDPSSAAAVNGSDLQSDQAAATAGAATKPAEVDPAVAATREKFKALMDKLEKTGGSSGAAAPAAGAAAKPAAKPATGAATKPAAGGATMPAVDAMGNATGMPANESTLADDQILALIKGM